MHVDPYWRSPRSMTLIDKEWIVQNALDVATRTPEIRKARERAERRRRIATLKID